MMKSCLDLKRPASSCAATMPMVRFFDSILGLDSMYSFSAIIADCDGELFKYQANCYENAGTYGKDTSPKIRFTFSTIPELLKDIPKNSDCEFSASEPLRRLPKS